MQHLHLTEFFAGSIILQTRSRIVAPNCQSEQLTGGFDFDSGFCAQ